MDLTDLTMTQLATVYRTIATTEFERQVVREEITNRLSAIYAGKGTGDLPLDTERVWS